MYIVNCCDATEFKPIVLMYGKKDRNRSFTTRKRFDMGLLLFGLILPGLSPIALSHYVKCK